MVVEDIRTAEWASITFTGLRHEFDLRLEGGQASVGAALDRLTESLGEIDVPMAGHFLAEIAVAAVATSAAIVDGAPGRFTQRLRIEALTVRD